MKQTIMISQPMKDLSSEKIIEVREMPFTHWKLLVTM